MKKYQDTSELLLPGDGLVPSRRAFLEIAGFGLSAAALGACSPGPRTKLVPGLEGPENYVAGKAYWVASTCDACSARCGLLAKCRDGRPIKLEGNPQHGLSQGGLCATGQADLLSLYDSKRLRAPRREGQVTTWERVDMEMIDTLNAARQAGKKLRLLTGTQNGPSTRAAIAQLLQQNPGAEHVSYDALSCSALMEAQALLFGRRALPSFHFEKAHVLASFAADFLGTWIAPVAFARAYAEARRPDEGRMSLHVQLEGAMSMTGSVADQRIGLTPGETALALANLCALLEQKAGRPKLLGKLEEGPHARELEALSSKLWEARGHALVICGLNELKAQVFVAYANHLLGNYGQTLSLACPSLQRMGDDKALWKLKAELDAGEVDCLIVSGLNPAHGLPDDFGASMRRARLLVQHGGQDDESAALAQLVLPAAHALESWGDAEPVFGRFGLQQPLIPRFREVRTLRHMLHAWMGDARSDDTLLREHWESEVHALVAPAESFASFYRSALHEGFVSSAADTGSEPAFLPAGVAQALPVAAATGELELFLYPKVGILDGEHAHNPWLQELPNPVTKVTWDNYASLSPERAEAMGLEQGDLVRVSVGEESIELPVLVQRGQHANLVAIALGYGRKGTDRFSEVGPNWLEGRRTVEPGQTVGVNAAPLSVLDADGMHFARAGVVLEKLLGHVDLAATQEHHTLELPAHLAPKGAEVRDAVLSASLADYVKDPEHAIHSGHHPTDTDLWSQDHEPAHHHWGMAVDLSSCNGCSACVISCQAENNVPVVGKDEVLRHREMHWMRIDRYFEGEAGAATASHQPMFCQQCDNAPCESVCPVLATVHSDEGLNQQIYNRCVGTRYCANTCPYKVRRFNWFDYPREDKLQNHSLNPDVTIRTRGVMEKCSFCAQRIQEARSEAIRKGVPLADGDIQVACQQSCPPKAIVFGDMLDPESKLSKLMQKQRSYRVLDELNVKPSVHYLARIRNRDEEGAHHG